MRRSASASVSFAFLFCFSGSSGWAAADCESISIAAEKTRLTKLMSRHGFDDEQRRFLIERSSSQLRALSSKNLNEKGGSCGIESVRAHVLACTNGSLPSLLKSSTRPLDQQQGKTFWGKKRMTVRELLFVGSFTSCLGAAKETLFKR